MNFNWRQYLENYPDLGKAGIKTKEQAIIHFRRHGESEGRTDTLPKLKVIPKESKKLFDIVIPLGPNDYRNIFSMVSYCKNNINDYNQIYIVTCLDIKIENCITIPESFFPFKLNEIHIRQDRNNWYFQQLLKMYSYIIPGILENFLVIDADTYFLKPTDFFENGIPLYNTSDEHNLPYFEHLNLLHESLYRKENVSGICHHMMFNCGILKELMDFLSPEIEFWKYWLSKINPDHFSGASEYELYFNYLLIYHPKLIKIRPLKWNNVTHLTNEDYDYISIHWYSN